jgi:hypothetical protein
MLREGAERALAHACLDQSLVDEPPSDSAEPSEAVGDEGRDRLRDE